MKDSEILSMLNCITDDHAENSDFGGHIDANDCLSIEVSTSESSMTRSLHSSGQSNIPEFNSAHSAESPFSPSTS